MKKKLIWLPPNKWYSKHLSSIFAFIIIMGFAVLIYLFAIDIPKNVIDILLGFAAIAATFFTYLAFNENRRSNQIKLYDDHYKEYKKYTVDEEEKMNRKIFANTGKLLADQIHNYNDNFTVLTMREYLYMSPKIFKAITNNHIYKKYIKLLEKRKSVILNDDEDILEASKFADALFELCELNATAALNYGHFLHLCNEIDLFPYLFQEQKDLFMIRLRGVYCDYNSLVFSLLDNSKGYKIINRFNYFKVEGNKLIKYNFNIDGVLDDYKYYSKLIKKYFFLHS